MLFDWIERENQGLSSESKITTFAPVKRKLCSLKVDYKIDYTVTKYRDILDLSTMTLLLPLLKDVALASLALSLI